MSHLERYQGNQIKVMIFGKATYLELMAEVNDFLEGLTDNVIVLDINFQDLPSWSSVMITYTEEE